MEYNNKLLIKNKKLKAFTLLEMLVGLVISGIVFSMAGLCYNMLLGNYTKFKFTSEKVMNVKQLQEVIAHDIFTGKSIVATSDGFTVTETPHSVLIDYHFNADYIIRTTYNHNDTFKLKLLERKSLFMGKERWDTGLLINECLLKVELLDEQTNLRFYKNYASDVLIKEEELNGH